MIAQAAFWCSVALVFYAYFGYPMALAMISLFRNRPVAKRKITPRVSFIIAAHNEERRIRDKIDNTLAQDYPSQALEVIVASDCSSDRTDDIVSAYSPRVRLTRAPERRGKEAAQQLALESASGEIVIFSDVATALAPDGVSDDGHELRGSDSRLRQQRRSLHRCRWTGERRGRVRQIRDVPPRSRDPGQQPGWAERLVLCRAPGGVPAVVRGSPERLQHAAECRRAGLTRRAGRAERRLLQEHRRRSAGSFSERSERS